MLEKTMQYQYMYRLLWDRPNVVCLEFTKLQGFRSLLERVCGVMSYFEYLSLCDFVSFPGLLSTLILKEKGLKVMQHCHQWVLIPIQLHLCGTNPPVPSWTISESQTCAQNNSSLSQQNEQWESNKLATRNGAVKPSIY